jgi:hypothetical protein
MVLFCHIINTRNTADLNRLCQFVASLLQTSQRNGPIARFHRLCDLFYQVAVLYCSSAVDEKSNETADIWPEMDDYLITLGFGQKDDTSQMDNVAAINSSYLGGPPNSYVPPNDISHWFQGTQYMAELLDQDHSYLHDSPM